MFAPWAIRDWAVFGNPLPGQAVTNALSLTGFDIFAWNDPPTLARYLAVGPGGLLEMRVDGLSHNLFNVLLLLGHPDLAARPARAAVAGPRSGPAARRCSWPCSTFLATSLAVPGGDDVGHVPPRRGAGPRAAADRVRARRARRGHRRGSGDDSAGRGRWRGSVRCSRSSRSALFSVALLPQLRRRRATPRLAPTRSLGRADGRRSARRSTAAHPSSTTSRSGSRRPSASRRLALPDETPVGRPRPRDPLRRQVAHRRQGRARRSGPRSSTGRTPTPSCFEEVLLPIPADPADAEAIEGIRVFRISCAGVAVSTGVTASTERTAASARLSP